MQRLATFLFKHPSLMLLTALVGIVGLFASIYLLRQGGWGWIAWAVVGLTVLSWLLLLVIFVYKDEDPEPPEWGVDAGDAGDEGDGLGAEDEH